MAKQHKTAQDSTSKNSAKLATAGDKQLRAAMLPWAVIAGLTVLMLGGVAVVAYFGLGTGLDMGTGTGTSTGTGTGSPRPAGPPADGSESSTLTTNHAAEARQDREEGNSTLRAVSTGQNGVRLQLQAEPEAPTVGDPIPVTLTLSVPEARVDLVEDDPFDAESLQAGQPWGDAEILRTGSTRRTSSEGRVRLSRELTVTAFQSGDVELVPLPLRLGEVELLTPPARLSIRSVLASGEDLTGNDPLAEVDASNGGATATLEARPYHPPVQLPLGRPFWWTAAVLSLACLLLAGHLWRQGPTSADPAKTPGGALVDLLALLDELRQETSAEAFHVKLSLGLRQYLGRNLDFAAPECTTREVAYRLDMHRQQRHRPRLETSLETLELLHSCDRVKFAGEVIDPADLRRRLGETRRLVQTLDRELQPPSPSAALATSAAAARPSKAAA